jgi:hypothetical protein
VCNQTSRKTQRGAIKQRQTNYDIEIVTHDSTAITRQGNQVNVSIVKKNDR